MLFIPHPIPVLGTIAVLVVGAIILAVGHKIVANRSNNPKEEYRRQRLLSTLVVVIGAVIIVALWSRLFQHTRIFRASLGPV